MEYKGQKIDVVQLLERQSFKWTVTFEDQSLKIGTAGDRASAYRLAMLGIDRAFKKRDAKSAKMIRHEN